VPVLLKNKQAKYFHTTKSNRAKIISKEKMNNSNQRVELVKRDVELQYLNRETLLVVCAAMWWALNK
jgi:hypothetical protein